MPSVAEVENDGCVQLADPVLTGALVAGAPDDMPPPDGAGLPDDEGRPDALADADGVGRERGFRAEEGMTAICGLETTCGIADAPDAAAPAPGAVERSDKPSSAAGLPPAPCPLPTKVTVVTPPPASRAHATATPIRPRREGGRNWRQRGCVGWVPASYSWLLVALWRTCRSLRAPGSW